MSKTTKITQVDNFANGLFGGPTLRHAASEAVTGRILPITLCEGGGWAEFNDMSEVNCPDCIREMAEYAASQAAKGEEDGK